MTKSQIAREETKKQQQFGARYSVIKGTTRDARVARYCVIKAGHVVAVSTREAEFFVTKPTRYRVR